LRRNAVVFLRLQADQRCEHRRRSDGVVLAGESLIFGASAFAFGFDFEPVSFSFAATAERAATWVSIATETWRLPVRSRACGDST
jgi:hypothetical protein